MNIQSCMYPIKQFHSSNWKPTLFITRWWGRNKKLNCWPIGAWKSHAGLSVYTVGILLAKWGWIPALDQWVLSRVIVSLWAPTTQTPSFQQHHPSWHGLQAQYRIIPVHRPNLKPPSHSADLVRITVIDLPDSIKFGKWSIMGKNTFSLHAENMSVCILLCESMWLGCMWKCICMHSLYAHMLIWNELPMFNTFTSQVIHLSRFSQSSQSNFSESHSVIMP